MRRSRTYLSLFGVFGVLVISLLVIIGLSYIIVSTNIGNFSSSTLQLAQENEYISYGDVNDGIISPFRFGVSKYECSGKCYCEESQRRLSVPLISRSISFLVLSVSSVAAYSKAKSYFENECLEHLSSGCHLSSIKSSVDDCSKSIDSETNEENFKKRNEEERRVYYCYGNCVENLHHLKEETKQQFSEKIDCGSLRQEGEIIVYESDLINKSVKMDRSKKFRKTAREKFQEYHLTEFCRENSKMEYEYETTQFGTNGKEYPLRQKKTGFGCVGGSHYHGGKKSSRRNVRCRQIDPEPTARNTKYQDRIWWEEKQEWDEGRIVL